MPVNPYTSCRPACGSIIAAINDKQRPGQCSALISHLSPFFALNSKLAPEKA
jgi:hypothetical protein